MTYLGIRRTNLAPLIFQDFSSLYPPFMYAQRQYLLHSPLGVLPLSWPAGLVPQDPSVTLLVQSVCHSTN
jgi:hypothetical protein